MTTTSNTTAMAATTNFVLPNTTFPAASPPNNNNINHHNNNKLSAADVDARTRTPRHVHHPTPVTPVGMTSPGVRPNGTTLFTPSNQNNNNTSFGLSSVSPSTAVLTPVLWASAAEEHTARQPSLTLPRSLSLDSEVGNTEMLDIFADDAEATKHTTTPSAAATSITTTAATAITAPSVSTSSVRLTIAANLSRQSQNPTPHTQTTASPLYLPGYGAKYATTVASGRRSCNRRDVDNTTAPIAPQVSSMCDAQWALVAALDNVVHTGRLAMVALAACGAVAALRELGVPPPAVCAAKLGVCAWFVHEAYPTYGTTTTTD
eukprot:PhM_4_TR13677/c5_g1_i7/m.19443